jgi:hypothetical protein
MTSDRRVWDGTSAASFVRAKHGPMAGSGVTYRPRALPDPYGAATNKGHAICL